MNKVTDVPNKVADDHIKLVRLLPIFKPVETCCILNVIIEYNQFGYWDVMC